MAQNLEKIQEILDEISDDWFSACDAYRTATDVIGADRESWERNFIALASFGRSQSHPSFGDTLWKLREETKSAVKGRNKLAVNKMFNDFTAGLKSTAEYFDIETKGAFDITPPERICEIQGNRGSFKRSEKVAIKDANFSFWTYHSYLYPEVDLDDKGEYKDSSDIRVIDAKEKYEENLQTNTKIDDQIASVEDAVETLRNQRVQSVANEMADALLANDGKEDTASKII